MSPKKFWKLEIYDWSLWMRRINNLIETRDQDFRVQMIMHRNWMSLYYNSVSKEKISPQDVYKFPEEIEKSEPVQKISQEDLDKKVKEITQARKRNGK